MLLVGSARHNGACIGDRLYVLYTRVLVDTYGNKSGIRNKIRYVTVIHYWVEEFSKRTGTKWKLRASEVIGWKHLWW